MVRSFLWSIVHLDSMYLGRTCKVALEALVYQDSHVTRAVSSFGFGPFCYGGKQTPELFDYCIVRLDRSETVTGTEQVGNQVTHAQNSSKIVRTYLRRRHHCSNSNAIRYRKRRDTHDHRTPIIKAKLAKCDARNAQ